MNEPLRLSKKEMREIGYHVIDMIVDRFETIADGPAIRVGDRVQLSEALSEPMPEDGHSFEEIVNRLREDVLPYMVNLAHPRFLAFISAPSNFIGAMADAIAAGYNPFVGTWLGGSGPTQLELVTIGWLRDMCGLPKSGGGLFVSGGSNANLTGIATARHVKAKDGIEKKTVYFSNQSHYTNERALRVLGFSPQQMRLIPCDNGYAMDAAALREAIATDVAGGLEPFCVVGTAGTTNVGAVDPLDEIADICADCDAWFHVDGAYGAAAMMLPELHPVMMGIGRADSLSLDPHKWMFQPFEIGSILVKDVTHLKDTFQIMPDYLKDAHGLGEMNFTDYGLQLTRGFRALKLWMTLQYFGAGEFRRGIAHGLALSEFAEGELRRRSAHWEVVTPAQLAIVSFRYVKEGWDLEAVNRLNDNIIAELMADGFAMLSSTILDGRTALRFCTINPSTTESDIEETISRLEVIAARLVAAMP